MHPLLRIVSALVLLACVAAAQVRNVRLKLENGRTVAGRVLHLDQEQIVVEVDGVACTFAVRDIQGPPEFETMPDPVVGVQPGTGTDPEPGAGERETTPGSMPARRLPSTRRRPQASSPPAAVGLPRLTARLEALDQRYPWLAPADPLQWVSLGVTLLALVSLGIHLGVKLVTVDPPSFGRSLLLSLLFGLAAVVQAATLPQNDSAAVFALAVNGILAVLGIKAVHRVPMLAAFGATLLFAVFGSVGFGVIELIDTMLRSVGNTAY